SRSRKIAGLYAGVAVVLMVVTIRRRGEAQKCEILRAQPFPQLLVGSQYHGGLAARLNQQIRLVVGVETRVFMVERSAVTQPATPSHNPSLFRTEEIARPLLRVAEVHAVHESRHGHEPWAHVLVGPHVIKVQPSAPDGEEIRRSGIVVFVAGLSRTEREKAGLASRIDIRRD